MNTVTDAYLLGIREGRDLLRSLDAAPTLNEMRAFADNCATQLKRGFSGEMRDVFKGERDFWLNQIKRSPC